MKKPPRKINILYILAFQLIGFNSVLFLESEPAHPNNQKTNIAIENAIPEMQDFAMTQVCTPEGCQQMGP